MNASQIAGIAIFVIPIIIAITFHEAAHGYVALYFGDDTAKKAGRLTLNPLKHIDPFGTILLPLLLYLTSGSAFGWAKPVPVNFSALKDPRWDMGFVAAAGPAMNILLALISAVLLRLAFYAGPTAQPVVASLFDQSLTLNVILAVFNMLPIPPLDGSKIVAPLLPQALARPYLALERFGMLILLLILIVLPILASRSGFGFNLFDMLVLGPAEDIVRVIMRLFGI
jgi:Zn-dependent protease